jgi:hypothetical protein
LSDFAIADVRLRIRSHRPLLEPRDSLLPPFSVAESSLLTQSSIIDVQVLPAAYSPSESDAIFRSGSTWDMQLEGDDYRLTFRRGVNGELSTIAFSDAQTERVRIHVRQGAESSEAFIDHILNPVQYPLDQLLFMNHLASRGGVIVHAAGAVVNGQALVFPGVSTAGKSTLSRLFAGAGMGESLLSDDRIILRTITGGGDSIPRVDAWGTPWAGDAQIARNACAQLAGLLFLVKADANELLPLAPGAAMRRLMPVVSCPWYDKERGNQVLATCGRIVENIPCYDLRFRPDGDVVKLLTGGSWSGGAVQVSGGQA